MKYLITGCAGFIGKRVVEILDGDNELILISRSSLKKKEGIAHKINTTELQADFSNIGSYSSLLLGVDCVIHLAALAHVKSDHSSYHSSDMKRVNFHGTLDLANHAAKAGVRRFVFISSIGVNGLSSKVPFKESDAPTPHNHYALSKHEAEKGLLNIASRTNMEVVIIRPPLVYGPAPPGNFALLIKLLKTSCPIPFARANKNKRSLVALENLVDFILLCSDYKKSPQAANKTFLISDGEDVSTAELFRRVSLAYDTKSHLFSFPVSLLSLIATILGKQDMANSLFNSLQVDNSKARELLGWVPVITMDEQLKKMADMDY